MSERNREECRAAFQKAYASLNAAQKQAVDTVEGPVMVVAGPGTGKTQVLTLRIANIILTTDTAPESILALTFTDAGAVNMRDRLRVFLGSEAYRVPIFTFHAFCEHLIRTYPESYERIIGGRLASDIERSAMIESVLESGAFPHLRPPGNPIFHLGTIARQLDELKREAIGPSELSRIIAEQEALLANIEPVHTKGAHKGKPRSEYRDQQKVIARNQELLAVYQRYEALLRAEHLYDYNDMVLETISALENSEDMRLSVQELYQYVHADEHQDVNHSQNRILELITSYHAQPNVFVVGDEKQAIFRFQGASLENFLYFSDTFGDTTVIALTENYRSGQTVLDTAHSLIAVDGGPLKELRVPLVAKKTESGSVRLTQYSHQVLEDDALVASIKESLSEGTPPSEVAVIVRTNREVEAVAERLAAAGIDVASTAGADVLTHPVTDSISTLLSAVFHPENASALASILHSGFVGIDRTDLVRVLAAQSYDAPLLSIVSDETALRAAGVRTVEPFLKLMDAIHTAHELDGIEPPHRIVSTLLQETGFLDHVATNDPVAGTRLVRCLYDEIEGVVRSNKAATLKHVLDTLDQHRRYGVALNVPALPSSAEAVHIMTAHKAKGLEFEVVFAPHLLDSAWGGSKKKSFFTIPLSNLSNDAIDIDDDERRLLYVLLTRAKRTIRLSYAERSVEGKDKSPSRFIAELDAELLEHRDSSVGESHADLLASVRPMPRPSLDPQLFKVLLEQRGVSATSLNNYLESPWTFVYRNLLRMPAVQSESLLFGNVVHDVLEWATKRRSTAGALPDPTELKVRIDRALGRLPLSDTERSRLHQRAFAALVPYTEWLAKTLPPVTREEFKLSVKLPTGLPELPELLLTGKLDRLDVGEDGRLLRVVDYKTGKPKTRGQIEGSTKDSEGNYKRQLVFYALLLQLHGDQNLQTRNGAISFVEPNQNGDIKEEVFTVTDDELAGLKQDILTLASSVIDGSFMAAPCDPDRCDYCHLVALL